MSNEEQVRADGEMHMLSIPQYSDVYQARGVEDASREVVRGQLVTLSAQNITAADLRPRDADVPSNQNPSMNADWRG